MIGIHFDKKRHTVELHNEKNEYTGTLYGIWSISYKNVQKVNDRTIGSFLLHNKDGTVMGILEGWKR